MEYTNIKKYIDFGFTPQPCYTSYTSPTLLDQQVSSIRLLLGRTRALSIEPNGPLSLVDYLADNDREKIRSRLAWATDCLPI